MISALLLVFISLGLAYLLAELVKKIGLPRVVGQIIAGVILGITVIKSALLGDTNVTVLSFLANLGVILLFYYAGLEMNLGAFTKNLKKSILVAVFNTVVPLSLGFVVMHYLLGFDALASLIVGIALSVSAQAVSLDILEELKLITTPLGRIIVSIGAVDDVFELLLVTSILSFLHSALEEVTFTGLIYDLLLFLGIVIIVRLLVVPYILKFFDHEKSTTARFTGALLILLLFATLAEALQLSSLIGALIAGMMVRQTIFKDKSIPNWEEHNIASSLHIIAFGFLIPLFFVWVGINTSVAAAIHNIPLIIILNIIAFLGTIGGTVIAIVLAKGSWREGWILGWGVNSKGDVELIIAFLALQAGIISNSIFTSLVAMSLITTIISPVIFKYLVVRYHLENKKRLVQT